MSEAELKTEIQRLWNALHTIAVMPDEDNEWDGRDKYWAARAIARDVIAATDRIQHLAD